MRYVRGITNKYQITFNINNNKCYYIGIHNNNKKINKSYYNNDNERDIVERCTVSFELFEMYATYFFLTHNLLLN
jgi:hypothetical protein